MTEEQLVEAMADAYNPAWANKIPGEPDEVYAAYRTRIRRDMSRVLAVVREHIALELEAESECTPCSEDALVVRGCADLVRASGSYDRVDEIISARQHDGAALAEANASLALVSGNRDALAAALVAVATVIRSELGRPWAFQSSAILDALIARGWGPTADAEAEIVRLKNDVKELRDIRDLFVGWPTPIHMQDAMMEMRKRTWREAHAQGWREGREAAAGRAEGYFDKLHPPEGWSDDEKEGYGNGCCDMAMAIVAAIRAIPEPEQNEGRGNG